MSVTPLPLAGVCVLDVATVIAAPFCATILGEFGAEVIKVEMPGQGDSLRRYGAISSAGPAFAWLNEGRNKKSITLDLRKEKGQQILKRLVAGADIMVENFRPGTLESWNLGYEELKKIKNDLIMVRVTAYGQDGPYRDRPGFARLAHGFSGLAHLSGEPGGAPQSPGSVALADYLSGLYGALGALLSFTARNRYGIGQYVDIGLYEGIFRLLDEMVPAYSATGKIAQRMGTEASHLVPHNHYQAKDGKWVAIACTIQRMFERLTVVMGRPELMEPDQFATMDQRIARREELNKIVGDWVGTMDREQVLSRCMEGEVPAGPIYDVADIFQDDHYRARHNLLEVPDPRLGSLVVPNVVPRLSETPGEVRWLGPDLGQHNLEIYRDRLGMSESEMEQLHQEGVI